MTVDTPSTAHDTIRQLLTSINDAWRTGQPEQLDAYFHNDMRMFQPGAPGPITGKQACIASYQDFSRQATINDYSEADHSINVWGTTAVASYAFEIAYSIGGAHSRTVGRDLFVFTLDEGRWLAVWRTILPAPTRKEAR